MKVIGENRIADLWDRIKNYVDPKADKIPEVNHGTSDTTFTLTPNIMHIWGEVSSLTLTFPEDTNSVLDEYLFTFTCPSDAATNLTLPSSIKWILQPELLVGKTYQVSIVNGLAGYLTDDMPATGQDNIIETVKVNGTALTPDANKAVDITVPQGTVTSVTVNGSNYTPDANGLVNLGTISGESGSGGEYNVIEGVTFNGTTAPITNKIAAITYTETDPTVPAAVKAITATDISNWNSKASTDTKNTAGATATTVTGSNKLYLIGASEQTANPTTNTINYFYVDASGLNIPTNINALSQTATLGKIILPGTGGGILADGTGGVQSTTKVWNTFGSYTDISGFATDSDVVHKSGEETIAGDKTFSGQVSFSSDNPVYFFGDNIVRSDIYITNLESGATNVQITTDDNNDNRVVVKASETGFSWIQASNGTLDLQSVLDAKLTSSDLPALSKGTTTGYGNAVTDISVSGHTITLTKGTEFLTTGASSDDILYDPSASASTSTIGPGQLTTCLEDIDSALDAKQNTSDKVTSISSSSTNTQYPSALAVYNFGTNLVSQLTTIYSGSGVPGSSLGNNGDIYIKVT